ncbi:MAG: flagellar biosynthesis anti-sigma factor FlgM [Oscillospiraceae bacterium]|nr:flagellar biosynthesis anti-sigma factor FlgM [Oscillospiraceae bacterium]
MKVGSLSRTPKFAPLVEAPRRNPVARAAFQETGKIDLSERASQFKALARAAGEAPDVRAEKVAAIRKQIEAGTYQVDSRAVADKMFDLVSKAPY